MVRRCSLPAGALALALPLLVLVLVLISLLPGVARAQPLDPRQVPPALAPWIPWVLRGAERERCPALPAGEDPWGDQDGGTCAWAGELRLELTAAGGRFTQSWEILADSDVPLPGDEERWPTEVRLAGRPVAVLAVEGKPRVRLPAGQHQLSGAFVWKKLPETLPLSPATGLVSLRNAGRAVLPRRDEEGTLFLGAAAGETPGAPAESDALDIDVQRKLTDAVPALLTTHLVLRVSGKPREVQLGRVLPDGFVPHAVDSPLPLRFEPDGRPRLQVRAGSWAVTLVARHAGPPAAVVRPAPDGPWKAGAEVWVFEAQPQLRVVIVEGAPPVNAGQTSLPNEWRSLPAYLMAVGTRLRLVERRRGDVDPPADDLRLSRQLWLDFDGGGYTARDVIQGRLSRSWRLEMGPEVALGRVAVGGADQFITRLPDGPAGVEIRQAQVQVSADSRMTGARGDLPAVGWQHDFRSVAATLAIPPGWRLLHAAGADEVETTWLKRWTLLDLFLLTVLVMATARLFGRWPAALALLTMVLIVQEPEAPAWIWLAVLLGEALVRALPAGRLRRLAKLYRLGAAVALVMIALPFAVQQARTALHPALESRRETSAHVRYMQSGDDDFKNMVAESAPAPPPVAAAAPAKRKRQVAQKQDGDAAQESEEEGGFDSVEGSLGGLVARDAGRVANLGSLQGVGGGAASRVRSQPAAPPPRSQSVQGLDPDARIQTGPGVPSWQWRQVRLDWNGPVKSDARLTLWLAPPWLVSLLGLMSAVLVVVLSLALLRNGLSLLGHWLPGAAALALVLWLPGSQAQAQVAPGAFPPKELLDELRTRLLKKPTCAPACGSFGRLAIEASPERLRLRLEVNAAADTVVPLPGLAQHWTPDVVLVGGRATAGLRRDSGGRLWLLVPAGAHQVVLEGPVNDRPSVQISFGSLRPHGVSTSLRGFTVNGVAEDGAVGESLELVRAAGAAGVAPPGAAAAEQALANLPPFVLVERTIELGLEWRVRTRVIRQTPPGAAVVIEVPLLANESVLSGETKVAVGKVQVNMGPHEEESAWSSALAQRSPIVMQAAPASAAASYAERWLLVVSPLWSVRLAGIPPEHPGTPTGERVRAFSPWPGESVSVTVTRPAGAPGSTFTIDASQLTLSPGARSTGAELNLALRSSRGGVHTVLLPEGATLESFRIDGRDQPLVTEGRRVTLPLSPGAQGVALGFRSGAGLVPLYRTPEIDLGAPSVNADVKVRLAADRWVLLVGGPRLGPAVLVWGVLLVLVLVAVFLGRSPLTPLSTRQWILLGIGFAPLSVWAAATVAGYLFALGWRRDRLRTSRPWVHDLVQVLLALWTVAAVMALFAVIQQGLLSRPDMDIVGNGSHASELRWYSDHASGPLPRAFVISLPLLVYHLAMLAWALWMAVALLRWSMWAWSCFTEGGLWRPLRRPRPTVESPPASTAR
jgi:hypothetical protein